VSTKPLSFNFLKDQSGVRSKILDAIDREIEAVSSQLPEDAVLVSRRQYQILVQIENELKAAQQCVMESLPIELAGGHLREIEGLVNQMVPRIHSNAYIDSIFSQFCLGK
jgi:tRNA U34 5-carboxymethylaminomethyl modifying GTPase MnmE/TrmE